MWQNPKLFQSTAQLRLPSQTPPPLTPATPTIPDHPPTSYSSTLSLKQYQCRFSRRDLAVFTTTTTTSSLSLLLLKPLLRKAQAEEDTPTTDENAQQEEINSSGTINDNSAAGNCLDRVTSTDPTTTKRAFIDISIDGEPAGRIVIGLFGNSAPAGVAKFSDFITGAAGISYRRKEFVKIMPNYVQHGGLRSYGVDAELAKKTTTGGNFAMEGLRDEWERVMNNGDCQGGGGTKNLEGRIGIVVRDPLKPPPKLKLVARKGKLEVDEEEVGKEPNGTEFTIAIKDSPELDAAVLVVGRVLEGMEVVQSIGQVKTVQENTTSPYFRVAKLIGDKRATVAERGFNRPYSKVVVSNCGLLD